MPDPLVLGELKLPLLIFGGPYSNLSATRAMRARADQLGIPPSRVICTGDLVAYCAEPRQTIDFIRDWGIHVVMGNCEESLANYADDCGCGFAPDSSCSLLSVTWYRHASRQVTDEQREWMSRIPRQLRFSAAGKDFVVIHGGYENINQFIFASTDAAVKNQQLQQADADCIIGGHSGIPFGQQLDDGAWLNSGVIGMPANDGTADGWFMLLQEAPSLTCSWQRLAYDYEPGAKATSDAGMREYGAALASGIWPSMDVLPEAERAQQGQPLAVPSLPLGLA